MNYKYSQFRHGQKFIATWKTGRQPDKTISGRVSVDSTGVYLCQHHFRGNTCIDKLDYPYSWILLYPDSNYRDGDMGVYDLKLIGTKDTRKNIYTMSTKRGEVII